VLQPCVDSPLRALVQCLTRVIVIILNILLASGRMKWVVVQNDWWNIGK
jgi:hypothetical protein